MIEFRGMDANGVMRYGRLSQDKPNETIYYKEFSQRICCDDSNIPVSNVSLGQFIELFDENEKKIYKGDIVKIKNDKCQIQKAEIIGIVIFAFASYGVEIKQVKTWENYNMEAPEIGSIIWFLYLINNKNVEVIGNETENPELIVLVA
jgi:uncharacterized phage protein (TIGR01671 family)